MGDCELGEYSEQPRTLSGNPMITKPKIQIDLEEVEKLAALGLSREQIADGLGISASTFYARQRESKDFAEAVKRGEAKGVGVVASALMKQIKEGNVTAMIFYLKAKAGWRDINRTELTGANGGAIAMNAVAQLTNEQLLEIARMTPEDDD